MCTRADELRIRWDGGERTSWNTASDAGSEKEEAAAAGKQVEVAPMFAEANTARFYYPTLLLVRRGKKRRRGYGEMQQHALGPLMEMTQK